MCSRIEYWSMSESHGNAKRKILNRQEFLLSLLNGNFLFWNLEKDPYPVDALPTCNHALSVCQQERRCIKLFEDFKTHCKVRENKCRMEDRWEGKGTDAESVLIPCMRASSPRLSLRFTSSFHKMSFRLYPEFWHIFHLDQKTILWKFLGNYGNLMRELKDIAATRVSKTQKLSFEFSSPYREACHEAWTNLRLVKLYV